MAFAIVGVHPFGQDSTQIVQYTTIGCLVASLFGVNLIKNFGNYPGVEQFFYIIPAFCASYGALLAFLIFARFPYSRLLLTSSFFASIVVFAVAHALLRRSMALRIGVVSEGDYSSLLESPGVKWRILAQPGEEVEDLDAVSVDLWCDLSDEWERELASLALRGIPVYHSKHLQESLTGKVQIEQLSENNFVGMQCGIMDMFASVMGKKDKVILLNCDTLEYKYIPFELGEYKVLLLDTNVKHSLASSAYNDRRKETRRKSITESLIDSARTPTCLQIGVVTVVT
ncbi:MAG: hypothetical protein EOO38_19820, partial [Cytophagaceae bacterium]